MPPGGMGGRTDGAEDGGLPSPGAAHAPFSESWQGGAAEETACPCSGGPQTPATGAGWQPGAPACACGAATISSTPTPRGPQGKWLRHSVGGLDHVAEPFSVGCGDAQRVPTPTPHPGGCHHSRGDHGGGSARGLDPRVMPELHAHLCSETLSPPSPPRPHLPPPLGPGEARGRPVQEGRGLARCHRGTGSAERPRQVAGTIVMQGLPLGTHCPCSV